MFSILWCLLGIVTGVLFGVIPGAGPFLAIATLYPLLQILDPFNILLFYISLLITTNYTNSVTGILYGIPGDAAAVTTARHGHKLFLKGKGHLAVSNNAISSTIGSVFAIILFLLFLPSIYSIFQFYNSTLQLGIICTAIVFLTLLSKQKIWKTVSLFLFGGVLAKIGFNNTTYETWGTFNIDYLTLGIPFSAVMICLYIVPELLKFRDVEMGKQKKINKFGYDPSTITSTGIGSFVGFWCGLIPGVTNILGSYLSANLVKKDLNKIAAAEAANNSGALSSLLPLIILGIPIVGSEVLIFYLIVTKGFIFSVDTMNYFTDILYYIPIVLIICVVLSWGCFNILGQLAQIYKKHKNILIISIVTFICIMSINIYPVKEWLVICLLVLGLIGYLLRKFDTFPILYGYFLTDLFWDNLMRVMVIY
jgi:putative tricarboxylic transport membrane protein|tara:strand:- start:391 stop:1656 length:1266 start_codon:yes stop_codon:yes gene_type:complete